MKKLFSYLICIFICSVSFAQTNQYDYQLLSRPPGTVTVTDPTSFKGTVIKRPVSAGPATAWYGPYLSLQAGSYQIQFRLKVSDNRSAATLCKLDVASSASNIVFASMDLKPNMFTRANEWQTITLNLQMPSTYTDIEFRGMEFLTNLDYNTDIYLDYINVVRTQDFFVGNLLVTGNGKVGINTTNPTETLTVKGNILTAKVKVTALSNIPDYVFEEGYPLPALREVADYIKQHKHLPEVPSAKEVEKNGLNLGDNQLTLLKKIEELTLYAIEQNKKLEVQQQQLKEQQALILKLNNQVNSQQKSINSLEKRVRK